MIEKDLYNLLSADLELASLLNATISDSKIYPIQMPQGSTLPLIIYRTIDDGTLDENIKESVVHFECVSDNYETSNSIRDRVQELLDIDNNISRLILTGDCHYYYSKLETTFDFKDPDLDMYHNIAAFNIKYIDIGCLLQENAFYLLQENGSRTKL